MDIKVDGFESHIGLEFILRNRSVSLSFFFLFFFFLSKIVVEENWCRMNENINLKIVKLIQNSFCILNELGGGGMSTCPVT